MPKEELSPRGKFNKCGLSKLRALSYICTNDSGSSVFRDHHFSLFAPAARFPPEAENVRDREADILGLTPETVFSSLGTLVSIS